MLLLSLEPSLGNGFRNPPESATGLATAGAHLTLADDASAMAFDCAHLAQINRPSGMVSVSLVGSGAEATTAWGRSDTEGGWYMLPSAFAAVPLGGDGLVAGLAVTAPFGQSTEWGEGSVFRYSAPYFAELRVINLNPTLALKLSDTLSLGVGLDQFNSDIDLRMIYPWSGVPGVRPDLDGKARFEGRGWGLGANGGLLWRPADHHAVAATYRSSVKVDYEGHFEISNTPPMPPGSPVTARSDFDSQIEFPAVAGLGYAWRCAPGVRVGADIEWLQFSTVDEMPLDIHNNNALLPPGASPMRQDWNDTWTAGLGVVWDLNDAWALRAGYIFLESPVPDETFSPTLMDGDQHVLTAGVTARLAAGQISAAGGFGLNEERTIRNNLNPAYNGTYDIENSRFVAVAYAVAF
jgi:long-chain fatty acid transport protein